MVAIVDYGVGNLFSLKSSLDQIGADSFISSNAEEIKKASRVILPGVGAFEDAAKKLSQLGLDLLIKDLARSGVPIMGICLGMQLLFEESHEYGVHKGLGILKGKVIPISSVAPQLKTPHMGWNSLTFAKNSRLFKYINENDFVYFVHSYYVTDCSESLASYTEYGTKITASVEKDNVFGCQFHPEKSGSVGLNILKAFCEED